MKTKLFMKKYGWLLALVVAVGFGYTFGKDLALRDNAKDNAQIESQTE